MINLVSNQPSLCQSESGGENSFVLVRPHRPCFTNLCANKYVSSPWIHVDSFEHMKLEDYICVVLKSVIYCTTLTSAGLTFSNLDSRSFISRSWSDSCDLIG